LAVELIFHSIPSSSHRLSGIGTVLSLISGTGKQQINHGKLIVRSVDF
jgi:hypothetical protein